MAGSGPRPAVVSGKRRRASRTLVWLSLLLALLLMLMQAMRADDPALGTPLTRLDALLYDWRFQLLAPQRAASLPIVIVDLDEETQQREGRWPWDRGKVADLIAALSQQGAVLIGFDVAFAEPGANPAQQLLQAPGLSAAVRRELGQAQEAFDGDAKLAQAVGASTLLGYFLHNSGVRAGALPAPFLELPPGEGERSALIAMNDYTGNLAQLTEHALGSGFITAVPDADGIVRRMPLVLRHGDGVYASLTLEMARLALGAPWLRLGLAQSADRSVATGVQVGKQVFVPLDAAGNMLVPYRAGAFGYPYLSATRVLRGQVPAGALEGAVVLVGTSALGLGDLRTIPLQTAYPGVEVHANVLDAILQAALGGDTFYYRPDWEPGATLLLLLVSGLVLALWLPGRAPALMLAASVGWLVLVVGLNFALWHVWHFVMPLATQVLMVIGLAAFNVAGGYLRTNHQKREMQAMFGQYVPPAYVERMVAHPELVSLAGEQREMTVLFADVRNFTTLSESLSATELKELLNRYLTPITRVLFDHHATIDKYVGDMVMAFWNAPLDDAGHADHAVAAALAMQQCVAGLRREFARDGLPQFEIGIGLNTGPMNVGDMGSSYRRAYTVLGDAVNLGSRLEGATRLYDVPILVSEATRSQAPAFLYRPVDLIRVKGKHEPVPVFEPLCLAAQADAIMREHVAQFEQALADYRARRWQEAQQRLRQLLASDPGRHTLYAQYLARMDGVDPARLPPDWAGIYDHEKK